MEPLEDQSRPRIAEQAVTVPVFEFFCLALILLTLGVFIGMLMVGPEPVEWWLTASLVGCAFANGLVLFRKATWSKSD